MKKAILYYTHNNLAPNIMEMVQEQLLKADLPIISVSLKPINFGKNVVMNNNLKPSILAMYKQIMAGLNHCAHHSYDYVFFCEHDVMYHRSHFSFTPVKEETYYYNVNVWRWRYPKDFFITYNHLVSLSGLCGHRDLLLRHYRKRLNLINALGFKDGRNPEWARKWGHEPGKPKHRGGLEDAVFEEYQSAHPNLDIRHEQCLTPEKMTLDSFRKQPTGWREGTFKEVITGWERSELWKSP